MKSCRVIFAKLPTGQILFQLLKSDPRYLACSQADCQHNRFAITGLSRKQVSDKSKAELKSYRHLFPVHVGGETGLLGVTLST